MPASLFLKALAALALLLMPLGIAAGGGAMAHGVPQVSSGSGHCPGGHEEPSSTPAPSVDCAMACSALPATGLQDVGTALDPVRPALPALASRIHGLAPEAATPPPRYS